MKMLVYVLMWCFALVIQAAEDFKNAKVAICAIVSNEELYIEEWLQYNQLLGFDFVQLYDNAEVPSKYMADLQKTYGDFLRIKHFPGMQRQVPAYKECVKTYKDHNTWAAIIDADEFIVLRKHKSIKDLVHELAPEGGGLVFNWRRMSNDGVKKHLPGPVVSRFTWTTKELSEYVKTMSYLAHVDWVNIHNTAMLPGHPKIDMSHRSVPNTNGNWQNNTGNADVAYICHYHTKSLEEYVIKRHRGRVDLPGRGGTVSYTDIAKEFEVYNTPYKEIQDFAARDFYLSHTNSTVNSTEAEKVDVQNSSVHSSVHNHSTSFGLHGATYVSTHYTEHTKPHTPHTSHSSRTDSHN